MKKTRLIIGVCATIAAAVVQLAIPSVGMAAAIFEDDFNSYYGGALTGQGGWLSYGATAVIGDGRAFCNSYRGGGRKAGDELTNGSMEFDFALVDNDVWMPNTEALFGFFQIMPIEFNWVGCDAQLSLYKDAGVVYAKDHTGTLPDTPISVNKWHVGRIAWVGHDFWIYVDDVLVSTGEDTTCQWEGYPEYDEYGQFGFGVIEGSLDTQLVIDNIREGSMPTIGGYAPILSPTSPPRNTETIVDFDDGFDITGTITIPDANTNIYQNLIITFRKPDSFLPAKTLALDIGGLTAGQSYNYSATTTVPVVSSGNNFFKVGYTLTGAPYAGSFADPPISQEMLAFDRTWVKDSVYDAPAYLITPSIKPEQDALEDCSGYTGIDAVICNFRNFVVGAFLPTDAALSQIGGTMEALKSKFPMNYARAVGDSFTAIAAGVDDDAGFSLTLFGNASSVDTSFFEQDIGGGATLGGVIKLFLTFLVFMIFFGWAIRYMHRLLPK